jgi:hypothetical protein
MSFDDVTMRDLAHAKQLREGGRWRDACSAYANLQKRLPRDAVICHNRALCHLALGESGPAAVHSRRALQLNPELWQSGAIQSRALVMRGDLDGAMALLDVLQSQHPSAVDLAVELARLCLQQRGDAPRARNLVQPFINTPTAQQDAVLIDLISSLYDREADATADDVSRGLVKFSERYLSEASGAAPSHSLRDRARLRVGLISPQFHASPVYFFTYGALSLLAADVDLIFVSRGKHSDWATKKFRAISTEWIEVAGFAAADVAATLRNADIDVLIDLGGWMDPVALRALSSRPAKKMYKWVGGQAATTGLSVFDGFLTDDVQSPAGSERFHTEPLIRLKSGYVSYTPPPYMPQRIAAGKGSVVRIGVISNPAKVSREFLAELSGRLPDWQAQAGAAGRDLVLQFIDQRYRHDGLRDRIRCALLDAKLEFLMPDGHKAYLSAIGSLDAILDTWPYSGGLTTVEALFLGVPVYIRDGAIFCERHSIAHLSASGISPGAYRFDSFNGLPPELGEESGVCAANHVRSNHRSLAEELLKLFKIS